MTNEMQFITKVSNKYSIWDFFVYYLFICCKLSLLIVAAAVSIEVFTLGYILFCFVSIAAPSTCCVLVLPCEHFSPIMYA